MTITRCARKKYTNVYGNKKRINNLIVDVEAEIKILKT